MPAPLPVSGVSARSAAPSRRRSHGPADAQPDEDPAEDRGEDFDAGARARRGGRCRADARRRPRGDDRARGTQRRPARRRRPSRKRRRHRRDRTSRKRRPRRKRRLRPRRPAAAPQERSAEIFVLRQGHSAPAKIVPIRPGAFDALKAADPRPPETIRSNSAAPSGRRFARSPAPSSDARRRADRPQGETADAGRRHLPTRPRRANAR